MLTEEQQKLLSIVKKVKRGMGPTQAGLAMGHSYYMASTYGHRLLMQLVYMGLVEKEGDGRTVKYKAKQ